MLERNHSCVSHTNQEEGRMESAVCQEPDNWSHMSTLEHSVNALKAYPLT
jgi:hypothetical protein